MRKTLGEITVTTVWNGLDVTGILQDPGYEGDPSIPNGTNRLSLYAEYIAVETPNGEDISEYLTDEALSEIENVLIEEAT